LAAWNVTDDRTSVLTGRRLGPYHVQELLGVGGMGEVYRARDTKLGRDVALKILPHLFAADPERLGRFEREAHVLASLNHPNIAAIYGFEESDGVQALVLELVDGPTLADRIKDGPLPVSECLEIARQIADALEAARNRGVTHRDLKPANIKVRPDGMVKVLDFGLAKIGARELVDEALSQLSTETIAGTRSGLIVGTAPYMSPEQARGSSVDHRTDIWAFGCVLFEMLSGRSAFGGGTISDTIARILEREPDWQALPGHTPRPIRELLGQCLRKEAQYRLADIAVARLKIDQARRGGRHHRRGLLRPRTAAGITAALALLAVISWQPANTARLIQRVFTSAGQQVPRSDPHEPVTIFIADFQNPSRDADFDRTLEPMMARALEQAPFVNAFDRYRVPGLAGAPAPENLDETAAREFAIQHGAGVIVSGSIDGTGPRYELSIRAVQASSGTVIAAAKRQASNKQQVLAAAMSLAITVRQALGEELSESAETMALAGLSATPLEVLRHYVSALQAIEERRYVDAVATAQKAMELDPNFGLGYWLLAIASRNVGETQAAERYAAEALRHLDRMTERQRYAMRGTVQRVLGNWQQCAKEYGELLSRFPVDVIAHNQRALCLSLLRDLQGAVDEMKQLVAILPRRTIFRDNLALYANYAGDFALAEEQARMAQKPDAYTTVALAFAQVGRGLPAEAGRTYEELTDIDPPLGPSLAASGLGDVAVQEGRFAEAVRILERGAAADLALKNNERAARKLVAVAYAQLGRGQMRLAAAAAERALANTTRGSTRFLVARVFVAAGAIDRARSEAARISLGTFVSSDGIDEASGLSAEPEAYAKIIEAELALANEDPRLAIKLLTDANTLADTWLGHFTLGLAYLKVPAFPQAAAEFDLCVKRRGEAIALFFDEEPTYGLFPPVLYYQGLARQGLNRADVAESFRAYLNLRGKSTEDPLVREIQRRLSS
jgi:serine/threonine protein kinase/tetratricopeptide (TPR) repeat protein